MSRKFGKEKGENVMWAVLLMAIGGLGFYLSFLPRLAPGVRVWETIVSWVVFFFGLDYLSDTLELQKKIDMLSKKKRVIVLAILVAILVITTALLVVSRPG